MFKKGKWTEEEFKLLRKNKHLSLAELSIMLNRSRSSIANKKYRESIKKVDRVDWEKVLRENSHLTQQEIADKLGVSQPTITLKTKKYNVKVNKKEKEKYLEYEEYLLNNYGVKTYVEMSKELGIGVGQIKNYALDNRLVECREEYVMYIDDDYIKTGTIYELSDAAGIKPSMILWHSYNLSNANKISVFKI